MTTSAGALLHDFAVVHDGHAVADVPDDVEVVGHEQVRNAGVLLDLQEEVQHAGLGGEVKCTDGLIADNQLRRQSECPGDRDSLTLAAAELARSR